MAIIQKTSTLAEKVRVTIDYDDVAKKIVGVHYVNESKRKLHIESLGNVKWSYDSDKDESKDISLISIAQPSYNIDFAHMCTYGD